MCVNILKSEACQSIMKLQECTPQRVQFGAVADLLALFDPVLKGSVISV